LNATLTKFFYSAARIDKYDAYAGHHRNDQRRSTSPVSKMPRV
jgi:hypothetical protein